MKNYDFDKVIQRQNTASVKWDVPDEGELPFWVADMDFEAPPAITEAIKSRAAHGVFGYSEIPNELIPSICKHYNDKFGVSLNKDDIVFIPSVMPAANIACAMLGGRIMYFSPMYSHIRILNVETELEKTEVKLKKTKDEKGFDFFELDIDALERAYTPDVTTFIICNPHNPVGRVFKKDELLAISNFCQKHNITIICDEIHCELTLEGTHIPAFSVCDYMKNNSITLTSAGKIANIPGVPLGIAIIPNEDIRKRFKKHCAGKFAHTNVFASAALLKNYDGSCDDWKDSLREYLRQNRDYAEERIKSMSGLSITHIEGTYLLWIDASGLDLSEKPFEFFKKNAKVFLSDGADFGDEKCVRMNIACPRATLKEGLDRMESAINALLLK